MNFSQPFLNRHVCGFHSTLMHVYRLVFSSKIVDGKGSAQVCLAIAEKVIAWVRVKLRLISRVF